MPRAGTKDASVDDEEMNQLFDDVDKFVEVTVSVSVNKRKADPAEDEKPKKVKSDVIITDIFNLFLMLRG